MAWPVFLPVFKLVPVRRLRMTPTPEEPRPAKVFNALVVIGIGIL
jgi:hypothetical protein